jgi:hypothetical protein
LGPLTLAHDSAIIDCGMYCSVVHATHGPSPTVLTHRESFAQNLPHPQAPCNKWRPRQGPRSAGSCPGNAQHEQLTSYAVASALAYHIDRSRTPSDLGCFIGDTGLTAISQRGNRRYVILSAVSPPATSNETCSDRTCYANSAS